MRSKMADMRPKMAKMTPKIAKIRPGMAKLRPKLASCNALLMKLATHGSQRPLPSKLGGASE